MSQDVLVMNRIELLMATATVALLSACGGGGGGDASPTAPAASPSAPAASAPAPAAPARSYKMRIFGLVAGQYSLTCTPTGSSSSTSEQLTIGMRGELQLGGRPALSFATADAVFSVSQQVDAGAPNPSVAMLGKTGDTSIGMTFTGSGSPASAGQLLKEFFITNTAGTDLRCTPSAATGMSSGAWEDVIAETLGSSLGNLRCTVGASPIASAHQYAVANGRLTLVSSSGVSGSTSLSIDLRDESLGTAAGARRPGHSHRDDARQLRAYGLKLCSGSTMDLSRYAADGIVRLAVQSPGAERVACER